MGEVYLAPGTRSWVATSRMKVLPGRLRHDPDRLARFQREAEVLASLNHPNIGGIYGLKSERRDGPRHGVG